MSAHVGEPFKAGYLIGPALASDGYVIGKRPATPLVDAPAHPAAGPCRPVPHDATRSGYSVECVATTLFDLTTTTFNYSLALLKHIFHNSPPFSILRISSSTMSYTLKGNILSTVRPAPSRE